MNINAWMSLNVFNTCFGSSVGWSRCTAVKRYASTREGGSRGSNLPSKRARYGNMLNLAGCITRDFCTSGSSNWRPKASVADVQWHSCVNIQEDELYKIIMLIQFHHIGVSLQPDHRLYSWNHAKPDRHEAPGNHFPFKTMPKIAKTNYSRPKCQILQCHILWHEMYLIHLSYNLEKDYQTREGLRSPAGAQYITRY